jgi:HK97 family phage prohead protease
MQTKHLAIEHCELKFDDDAWKVSGYATVFNSYDKVSDRILPSAFDNYLAKGELPMMRFEHLRWVTPGKWERAWTDDKGLRVEGYLTRGHSVASDLRASMRHGTIKGLSQGFVTVEATKNEKGGNDIAEINLIEVSFTASPCEPKALVDSFKSELDTIGTLREFESFLREVGNFSKSMAIMTTGKMKALAQSESVSERNQKVQQLKSLADQYDLRNLLRK